MMLKNKLFNFSSQSTASRPKQVSKFFSLPWELRLEIYDLFIATYDEISTVTLLTSPQCHPFYPLLFVCHGMRVDIAAFFYPAASSERAFNNPTLCINFLCATRTHTHLISSLTVHFPANETTSVSTLLNLVPNVKHLLIHLHASPVGGFVEAERPDAIYNLPRRTGLSVLGKTIIRHRNRHNFFNHFLPENFHEKDHFHRDRLRPFKFLTTAADSKDRKLGHFTKIDFNYEWSNELSEKHIRLVELVERYGKLKLPKLHELRYLAVYGRPIGNGRVHFELSVLNLVLQMKKRAKGEAKEMVKGYGTRQWDHKARYLDVWIEGEFETPEFELDWKKIEEERLKDGAECLSLPDVREEFRNDVFPSLRT